MLLDTNEYCDNYKGFPLRSIKYSSILLVKHFLMSVPQIYDENQLVMTKTLQ